MKNFLTKALKRVICSFLITFLFSETLTFSEQQTYDTAELAPEISVIIPVYNTETNLEDCLTSVIGQSFAHLEIIIVDDGSTDSSPAIIKRFAETDARIKVITQENKGAAAARNAGLRLASGEYVAFVDSDDTIDVKTYERAYKKAEESGADIVMFGESRFSPQDKTYDNAFEALDAPGAIFLWNKLYRREFLLDNNLWIPEHIKCYHDDAFNCVALPKANRVACMQERLYHYRRKRPGSIQTASSLSRRVESVLNVARFVCEDWRKNGYIKKDGHWLLKKINRMFSGHARRLSEEKKIYYSKALLDIIRGDLYNENNISRLSKFYQTKLENWTKYAQM